MEAVWTITNAEYFVQKDGYDKLIHDVLYRCTVTDAATGNSAYYDGNSHPPLDDLSGFVEFENLTEEVLISWCFNQMGERLARKIEDRLRAEVEEKNAALQTDRSLPWSS